ncbi:MAG: hypothetical protein K6L73_07810 [Cellvibrionaceae bacterium]
MLKAGLWTALGSILGFVAWAIVGVIGLLSLKLAWADYAASVDTFSFTASMLWARLVVGVLSSFAAGWAAYIFTKTHKSPWVLGVPLLVYCAYMHFGVLWDSFPAWFHFIYVLSLLPLIILGGRVARSQRQDQQQEKCDEEEVADTDTVAT